MDGMLQIDFLVKTRPLPQGKLSETKNNSSQSLGISPHPPHYLIFLKKAE